jgi:arylsulfatase B
MHEWQYTPTWRGFDSFYGYYSGSQDYFLHTDADAAGVKGVDLHLDVGPDCGKWCSVPQLAVAGNYSSLLYSARALAVLEEHAASEFAGDPVFTYLAFQSVHCPIQVPEEYVAPYKHMDINRQEFAGMVAALDQAVGVVLDGYQKHGYRNNTLTIFTTDNGGPVGSWIDKESGVASPHGIGCATGSQNWPLRGESAGSIM